MKKRTMLVAAFASAIALMFAGPVSADPGREVERTYNFPAVGQGDVGGACFNPVPDVPPELWSCLRFPPEVGETHVAVTVTDSIGDAPYISIQQDNNDNFAWGCGTIEYGGGPTGVVSDPGHPGVLLFPIVGGPGGTAGPDVVVFAWFGPGVNDYGSPPNPCDGSTDLSGSGTAVFHKI